MQEFCSIVNFMVISTQPISNVPDCFPGGAVVKNPSANARDTGDVGSIPGQRRSLAGGNGNPFQYSRQDHLMDRGAWWAIVHEITKSQT